MKRLLSIGLFLVSAIFAMAETLPSKPTRYFNDYAGVVSAEVGRTLETKLAALEKQTTIEFIVAIYPKLDTDAGLESFTQRTAQSWKIGQKKTNNGLVLFFFVDDGSNHKAIRYEIGYGLEGALTDASSKLIIENEIIPALKINNWTAATTVGVDSAIKYVNGEYKAEAKPKDSSWGWKIWVICIIVAIWIFFLIIAPGPTMELTGVFFEIILAFATAGKSGGSSSRGGGGSFGGGGSSGRS